MLSKDDINHLCGDTFISQYDMYDMVEEAKAERGGLEEAVDDAEDDLEKQEAQKELDAWDAENAEALKELEEVYDECRSGETLIHDDRIRGYLEEQLYDCYPDLKNLPSFIEIDLGKTVDNMLDDYVSLEYGRVTYWYRNC